MREASGVGAGTVLGLAFLTRTAGITLVMAVALHALMSRRVRRALLPLAVASSFVLAWFVWGYFNRPVILGANTAYYESYFQTLKNIVQGTAVREGRSGWLILLEIIGRNAYMLLVVSVPLVCLGIN